MSQSASNQGLGHFAKGDVIYVPIPYPDKRDFYRELIQENNPGSKGASKGRPALILFKSQGDNFVVCPFTTKSGRPHEILVGNRDFRSGRFKDYEASFFRPNLIHTINKKFITEKCGTLRPDVTNRLIAEVIVLLNQDPEPATISQVFERPKAPKRIR